jgi:hypothetical protein
MPNKIKMKCKEFLKKTIEGDSNTELLLMEVPMN